VLHCFACCYAAITRQNWQGAEQTYLPVVRELRHLTCLGLTLTLEQNRPEPTEICNYLSGLVSLQHLYLLLVGGKPHPNDCLKLCQLSRLTHLDLTNADRAVGDTGAVALASSLPLLRHLDLSMCQISSEIVIPAMARLQYLTQLVMLRNLIADQAGCTALIRQLRDPNWPKLAVEW
jgi:hypothetical protein